MLTHTIAVAFVALIVLGPVSYLLQVAWQRGGVLRGLAAAALLAMLALVLWLLLPGEPGVPVEGRIGQFVGASGILLVVVGVMIGLASWLVGTRDRGRSGRPR